MCIPGHSGRRTHDLPTPGATRSTWKSHTSARQLLRDFPVGPITVSSGTSSHLKHMLGPVGPITVSSGTSSDLKHMLGPV